MVKLVFREILMLIFLLIFTTCTNNDLSKNVDSLLKKGKYSQLFSQLKYPKNPSKNLIDVRLTPMIDSNFFKLDSSSIAKTKNYIYDLSLNDTIKSLLLSETPNSFSVVGKIFNYKSIDTIMFEKGRSLFIVHALYSLKEVSEPYSLDPLAINKKELSPNTQIIFKMKRTLFGIKVISIESPDIHVSDE